MRSAFSLLEVIFAIVLATSVAVIGIRHLQTPGTTARDRSCDMRREVLQAHLDRYTDAVGRTTSRDLRELAVDAYAGNPMPTCPADGTAYTNERGVVICPTHR